MAQVCTAHLRVARCLKRAALKDWRMTVDNLSDEARAVLEYLKHTDDKRGWPLALEIRQDIELNVQRWLEKHTKELIKAIAEAVANRLDK